MAKSLFLLLWGLLLCGSFAIAQEESLPVDEGLGSIHLVVEEAPKKLYIGQLFAIRIKAILTHPSIAGVTTQWEGGIQCKPYNPDAPWIRHSDSIYYNTFYFQLTGSDFALPRMTLYAEEDTQPATLNLPRPALIKLNPDASFSGVLAESFKLLSAKTNFYDENSNIVLLEIETTGANSADFHLPFVKKDGIESSVVTLPKSAIYYYALVPPELKSFDFSYFDLTQNRFVKLSIPIVVEDDRVSTQLELNPKTGLYHQYKTIILLGLVIVIAVFTAIRRKLIYLLALGIVIFYTYLELSPMALVKLKNNSSVTILPTENATVFYITTMETPVEKLTHIDGYTKIILPNSKIGWVKDEAILKN